MARSLQYLWPACNSQAIFRTKLVNQAGADLVQLKFDGSLINPVTGYAEFLANSGTPRSITITADKDLRTFLFTIKGYQNGIPITTPYAGPNNNTGYYGGSFDIITSITIEPNPNANISIGTGAIGYFPLVNINLERDYLNYTLSFSHTNDAQTLTPTTVYFSTQNIATRGKTYDDLIINSEFENIFILKDFGSVQNYLYSAQNAISGLLVKLGGSAETNGNTIRLDFLQT